jgi:DNA-binding HxlR family transcriptional regulator
MRFQSMKGSEGRRTASVLSATLRHLERDGLVTRTVYPTVLPAVEYELADGGRNLHETLYALVVWTDDHVEMVQNSRAEYDKTAKLRRPAENRAHSGYVALGP